MSLAQIFLIFASSFLVAIFGTPLVRRLALAIGVLDKPAARKIHANPVPLLGGAAIYAGVVLTLIVVWGDHFVVREGMGILAGATIVAVCGAIDDKWGLSATIKLLGQLIACAALISSGIQVALFNSNLLNILLTVLWVTGISNAINFLDNMDGLSAGIAAVAAAFFLQLAVLNGQFLVAAMAAALLGACLGFLRHNFVPTRIFMGDTGSLFLGFVLAVLGVKLRFPAVTTLVSWMIPAVVLGVPLFDTTLVIVARLRRRVNPFNTAGRDHISHRLAALGATRREAVLICYLIGGSFGIIATMLTSANVREAYALAVLLLGAAGVAIWAFERYARYVP